MRPLYLIPGTTATCTPEVIKGCYAAIAFISRAFRRVLKLARTIADLAGSDFIAANHLAEAIQYRPRVGL